MIRNNKVTRRQSGVSLLRRRLANAVIYLRSCFDGKEALHGSQGACSCTNEQHRTVERRKGNAAKDSRKSDATDATVSCIARTLELVPGVEDPHVCRYGVEPTAPDDVDAFHGCLAAVVQLHALQKLHSWKHATCVTHIQVSSRCTLFYPPQSPQEATRCVGIGWQRDVWW